jgi:hypothetical protein
MPITHTHVGVYLHLRGTVHANNSAISITEIGETNTTSNTGLQCITDRMPCCGYQDRAGEWFFPDGTAVPRENNAMTLFRNRGDDGTVNLNRLSGITMPTGLFCCEVPNAVNIIDRVCANVGKSCIACKAAAIHVQNEYW